MNRSWLTPGAHAIGRLLHAGLVAVVLWGAGSLVACGFKETARGPADDIALVRAQSLILQTDSDVGAAAGDFSVGPDGMGRYSVPLWAPEGRTDMTPKLALSYSSGGASGGAIGVGWALSGGTSMIHRCRKNSRRQERPAPINFVDSGSEQYCLDDQPLVLISGTNGTVNAEYRTEPDSFAKIVLNDVKDGQPMRFTAFTRDGHVHSYGTTLTGGAPDYLTLLVSTTQARKDEKVVNSPASAAVYGWLRGSVRDRFALSPAA
jgi:hypothetical protein